ncbi:vacuolar transporter chaperone 1 [Fennellomyces sp. T-0311]|nr:vacuolar transporter chaperone 1 [Fennellomyces sp. T-0311]
MASASSSNAGPSSLDPSRNKRIAVPVRVEPKVYFANERTFLSWLNFTVVLGGFAVAMLNFGDRISRVSAALFTATAMFIMLYSLYTFHWRASKIRKREAAPYDDRIGPNALCLLLVLAVGINFYLRLGEDA